MKIGILFLSIILINITIQAAEVSLVVSVPADTPNDATISLGGDFNRWDPQSKGFQLEHGGDAKYTYTFKNLAVGKILHFKLTRGDWDSVEIAEDGSNIENRQYTVKEGNQTLPLKVAHWKDLSDLIPPSTITGNVVMEDIELPTFSGLRKIRIYLPADYQNTSRRYPVIYMSDGQNLFDKATTTAGEWQMDELMQRLSISGSKMTSIVVGIDHAGVNRTQEYNPFAFDNRMGKGIGKGEQWSDWLVDELKPRIDRTYRTKPDRNNTMIMGSSMGGLISCYTAIRHQDVISRAACLSSPFVKDLIGSDLLQFIKKQGRTHPMKIYFDMGDEEFGLFGPNILKGHDELYSIMLLAGFKDTEIRYEVIKGGVHSEDSWRQRTEDIISWLYD